jgi:hypothetical protein
MTGRCVIRVLAYTSDKAKGRGGEMSAAYSVVYYTTQHYQVPRTLHYNTPGHTYYAASRRVVSFSRVRLYSHIHAIAVSV